MNISFYFIIFYFFFLQGEEGIEGSRGEMGTRGEQVINSIYLRITIASTILINRHI